MKIAMRILTQISQQFKSIFKKYNTGILNGYRHLKLIFALKFCIDFFHFFIIEFKLECENKK